MINRSVLSLGAGRQKAMKPVDEQLEKTAATLQELAKYVTELEEENARLLETIYKNRMYRFTPVTSEEVYMRCMAKTNVDKPCKKKADKDGLCGQHYNIRWGHEWKCIDVGISTCDLCGLTTENRKRPDSKCPGKITTKEQQNGSSGNEATETGESRNTTASCKADANDQRPDGRYSGRDQRNQIRRDQRTEGARHREESGVTGPGVSGVTAGSTPGGPVSRRAGKASWNANDRNGAIGITSEQQAAIGSCAKCGGSEWNLFGKTRNKNQRFRCIDCGRTRVLRLGVDNGYTKVTVAILSVADLVIHQHPEWGVRKIAKYLGLSKVTTGRIVGKYRKGLPCGCGRSAGHRGWCSVRFSESPDRQRVVGLLNGTAKRRVGA